MSLKKIMLLATAVCALAAFAVPASASASHHFTDNTEAIGAGGVETDLHGNMAFTNVFGGYECTVTSDVTFTTEDAHVTSFDIDTKECEGAGVLENCKLIGHEATVTGQKLSASNPATATIVEENTNITIEHELALHNEFEFVENVCEIEELTLTFDHLTGTTEEENGYLTGIKFHPEENVGWTHLAPFELETLASGTLGATAGEKETISISTTE